MAKKPRVTLLTIPAELRNRIYEDVFEPTVTTTAHRLPDLLKTCRKIHNEAIELYYSMTTLLREPSPPTTFTISNLTFRRDWFMRLPPTYLGRVSTIRYRVPEFEAYFEVYLGMKQLPGAVLTEDGAWEMLGAAVAVARADLARGNVDEEKVEVPWVEFGEEEWVWKRMEEIEK